MNNDEPIQLRQQEEESVHFLDYWQILFSRKEIVIAVSLMMIITGIVITRQMPRVYSDSALIQVQGATPDINVFQQAYYRYDPIFLKTQFEIIKSRKIIEAVVRRERLDDILGMAYGWKNTRTAATTFDNTVKLIQNKVSLNIRRDTELIEISVRLDKPDTKDGEAATVAARIANAIAEEFQWQSQQASKNAAEEALRDLNAEIEKMNRDIFAAEEKLNQMREKHGITLLSDIDTGTATIRSSIARLTEEASRALRESEIKKYKYEKIVELSPTEAAGTLGITMGDISLQPLLAEKQKLEMQAIVQEQAGLGSQHPGVIQNQTLLREITSRIDERVAQIKLGLKIDYEQAQAEYDMYAARLAEEKNKEMELSSGASLELYKTQKDIEAMRSSRDILKQKLVFESVATKIPTTSVQVVEEAKTPETPIPVSPNFALNITLSVVAGLFLSVVLAFFVEYLDTTIKGVDDIEKYLNSNVLGVIPQRMRTLSDADARPKHSEVYRVLRMNIKSSPKFGDGKIILFTSASAGEGKSLTSFNLAYVCAQVDEKVLLIDSDLHRPRLHNIFNVDNSIGISNVIVGEATLDEAIVKSEHPNLDFLPSGRIASASVYGLMDTDEMKAILEEARQRYDRVIMDAPPMVGVSDTAQLVRICDGVALVVQHRKYPRALCKRARDMVTSMGGNLLGVVLNNVDASHDYSSYYYEHEYYYYYYTHDSDGRSKRTGRGKSKS
ncbi:MAG: polysaccharide biosynthesis tyrosine autokinase [Lentisphaerae bacterium]|nr:polysaccharide biosynthesis tyrosine autokinase [Lentisphaerota bacterium]